MFYNTSIAMHGLIGIFDRQFVGHSELFPIIIPIYYTHPSISGRYNQRLQPTPLGFAEII